MGVSKVTYAGTTLVDLTEDTVTSDTLLEGVTAHDASGEVVVGAFTPLYVGDDSVDVEIPSSTVWITPTLTSEFEAYSLTGESQAPCYAKKNDVVHICGAVKPTAAIPATYDDHVIFTLPEGYRPVRNLVTRCQGSGMNTWCCTVKTDGTVNFSRYGLSEYVEASATAWLPMSISFIIA